MPTATWSNVNTGRIKQDGALDYTAAERKLRWDEENRLTASDDNGFVTQLLGMMPTVNAR